MHDTDAGHWLRVSDEAGATLLHSRPYPRLAEALSAIARLRDSSASWRPRMSAEGEFYFSVVDIAGDELARSPMYVAPSDRDLAQATALGVLPTAVVVVRPAR